MEYRQLLDVSNAAMVSLIEAMFNMGLDVSLIWTQMAQALKDDGLELLESADVNITGNDVQSITTSFAEEFKKVGIVQRADIEEATDNKVIIELGWSSVHPLMQGEINPFNKLSTESLHAPLLDEILEACMAAV